ncbi:glycosyltransferase family 1 protein [Sphingomonas sp. ABOLG]|uniref:glycosyltransferase family 4 protein n=1 Tax=Sphingomonas sp. ABOLG TaxID=1985880 RepID=UPI000F7EECD9|nr:glycosyltransferase family 1 protein [Sphingomonas sp. ABOLG]
MKPDQLLSVYDDCPATWERRDAASGDHLVAAMRHALAAARPPPDAGRALLLDVTRLIACCWTGRLPTGIDRVCYAYLHHYAGRASAVIQHRGFIRVLDRRHTDALFDLLRDRRRGFQARIAAFAPRALAAGSAPPPGATYVNVGHTDFDLPSHTRWIGRHGLRPVYLIHDLIPITHKQLCRPHAVRRHLGRVANALRHGAGIVVSSQAVAEDLLRFARECRLKAPPLLVAPLAGATFETRRGLHGDAERYFLCVGTIEGRKNHVLLLEVWRRLRQRLGRAAPRLVIVGQWGRGAEQVRDMLARDPDLAEHVVRIDHCTDEELAGLMAGACAMLMPTLAEGYGLPMAEALGLRLPVIASDLPCFHEVGKGIPCLLDPHDVEAWAAVIARFGDDCPRYRRQIMQVRRFRPTTWGDHFDRVDEWLPTLERGDDAEAAHPAAPIGECEDVA